MLLLSHKRFCLKQKWVIEGTSYQQIRNSKLATDPAALLNSKLIGQLQLQIHVSHVQNIYLIHVVNMFI